MSAVTRRPHSVDTDPHPYFRIYSAGNFGEVAPQRLSPMSWSLVGEPMERATRRLVRRLWGRRIWAEGSHFSFLGYFGCRPYHNLAAYCHLSRSIPGLDPTHVTAAYFEGIDPPAEIKALREPATRRVFSSGRLVRELHDTGPRLRELEEKVADLEAGVRAAHTTGSPIAAYTLIEQAREVLDDCWGVHILTTASLVPLRQLQKRAYAKLVRHPDEVAQWLGRPRELVWDRLHRAAGTGDPYGPGDFLNSSFYEVADSHDPWREYVVRHRVHASGTGGNDTLVAPAEALAGMLSPWKRHTVRALATTVGETMAGREHSKSLVMRTLHVFRRLLPDLTAHLGVPADRWPYLTIKEVAGLPQQPGLARRAEPRVEACRAALAVPMPEHLDLSADNGAQRPWMPTAVRTTRGVAPGIAVGAVMTPDDDLPDGPCVLVCESADADVAPLLPFVSGVLTERGSELSHIAILSREYGIPCVVGYTAATSLDAKSTVSINGSTGEVIVYEPR